MRSRSNQIPRIGCLYYWNNVEKSATLGLKGSMCYLCHSPDLRSASKNQCVALAWSMCSLPHRVLCFIIFFFTNSDNQVTPVTVCDLNRSTVSKGIVRFIKELLSGDVSVAGWHDVKHLQNLCKNLWKLEPSTSDRALISFCIFLNNCGLHNRCA